MKKNKLDNMLESFIYNCNVYGNAILDGDFTKANKAYKKIITAKDYILSQERLELLAPNLNSDSISIKIWAARYLLFISTFSKQSEDILQSLSNSESNLLGTIAEQTLKEWRNGRLTLEY
ncbi:hypothetical protein [Pasteurella sp. PK-2025]|uniref:hypothetical protein n=1 Tax=unclassified Pasteurella TaxID=2621516 RepID=UPI003C712269